MTHINDTEEDIESKIADLADLKSYHTENKEFQDAKQCQEEINLLKKKLKLFKKNQQHPVTSW